jgi:hypothetical protein
VAARPGAWPASPAADETSVGEVEQADLARSDWWAAEQRRVGSTGSPLPRSQLGPAEWADAASLAPLSRGTVAASPIGTGTVGTGTVGTGTVGSGAVVTGTVGRGTAAALAVPSPAESGLAAGTAVVTGPRRRRGWIPLTRLWALLKVASMAYTTWWAMGYVHAGVGTTVSAYGAVCLFAGFGARWRKRFFGPGQLIEPELYEEIGRWLYRLGVALVLIGGAAVTARYLSH